MIELLKQCFDDEPTTDVVYALAYRILDPMGEQMINYPWFKFVHNKPSIHQTKYNYNILNYYYPVQSEDGLYFGGRKVIAPLHYYYKNFLEVLDARIF